MKGTIERCSHGRDTLFCYDCTFKRLAFLPKEARDACAVLIEDFPIFVARGLISMDVATQVATLFMNLQKGAVKEPESTATAPETLPRCSKSTIRKVGANIFERVLCSNAPNHDDDEWPCAFDRPETDSSGCCMTFTYKNDNAGKKRTVYCAEPLGHSGPCDFQRGT